MKFTVTVKPNSRIEKVEQISQTEFRVWVNAPAREGKANAAVLRLLAEKLQCPKSSLEIIGGLKSKKKMILCDGVYSGHPCMV